jgi:hypothetical protein
MTQFGKGLEIYMVHHDKSRSPTCEDCYHYWKGGNACDCGHSDHHGHMIVEGHPACDEFEDDD